jgi:hypothetical protein
VTRGVTQLKMRPYCLCFDLNIMVIGWGVRGLHSRPWAERALSS